MALIVKDRVQETTSTTGTGTLTLSGAVSGFQTFSSAIGNTNTTYYSITDGVNWEVGIGTVAAGTLSRDTVLSNSLGTTALINFSAGVKNVFVTYPADKAVTIDGVQTLTNKTLTSPTLTTPVLGTPASGTLTNCTGLPNAGLVNSSITINGSSVSLGGTASVGTVTSVTGTAPVVSSGGATPAISMAAATASVNGYMTSTYASKLDGIAAGATNVTNTNQLTNGAGFITSSGTSAACSGNAATATTLSGDQSNWASLRTSAVANMLGWKNYGNNHIIFDASASTSPTGSAVNNTNAAVAWSASYPSLMGWNGSSTYGLRVDSARVSDLTSGSSASCTGNAATATYASTAGRAYPYRVGGVDLNFNWSGQSGQPPWLWGGSDGSNMYVYNPSNFSVNYATTSGTSSACSGNAATATTASNAIGVGQSWTDVTASRALSTTYTNSTGRSIMVFLTIRGGASNGLFNVTVSINGTVYGRIAGWGLNVYSGSSIIIPSGATYAFAPTGTMSLNQWAELR